MAIVMTAPGIPMLFQGQEFLQDGWFKDTDELDWDKADQFGGIVELTADLIRLRLNKDGLTKGLTGQNIDVFHINDSGKVVAFRRSFEGGPGDDCIVVVNFSSQFYEHYTIELPSSGIWKRRFSSNREKYDDDFGGGSIAKLTAEPAGQDGQPCIAHFGLPPYTVLIYSQDAD